ncbi:S8 family serine peptidase, partial [Bacillus altitudinis]
MSFYLKSGDLKIDKLLEQLYNKNVALVSSSGNQGLKKNNYPSSNTKVLSVGGIKDTGEKWINSNYGYIDFVMPVQIKSYIDGEQIEGTSVSAAILTAFIANTKNCFFIKNNTELYKKLVVLAGKTERDSQIGYGQPNYKNMR